MTSTEARPGQSTPQRTESNDRSPGDDVEAEPTSAAGLVSATWYVACQVVANIASLKIVSLGGFAVSAGVFVYPLTFTLRDMLHKAVGKSHARTMIIVAALINLFTAAFLGLVVALPAAASWDLQAEFADVLGPTWRIVAASVTAMLIAELVDTEAYSYFVRRISSRHQWARVLFSNTVSIPLDSVIFVGIAFYGRLPAGALWSILAINIITKYAMALVSIPGIYLIKGGRGAR